MRSTGTVARTAVRKGAAEAPPPPPRRVNADECGTSNCSRASENDWRGSDWKVAAWCTGPADNLAIAASKRSHNSTSLESDDDGFPNPSDISDRINRVFKAAAA